MREFLFAVSALASLGFCGPLVAESVQDRTPGKHHRIGEFLRDRTFHTVTDRARYGLPPLPWGEIYVIADDQLVVVLIQNHQVVKLVRPNQTVLD